MTKHSAPAVLFTMFLVTLAFAGTADISGEWIVCIEDSDGAGISIRTSAGNSADALPSVGGRISSRPEYLPKTTTESYDLLILPQNAEFDFEANGSSLTGALLRGKTEKPILNGTVSGNGEKISFTIKETIKDKTYSYFYRGQISGDIIKFEVTPEYGDAQRRRFTVKRVIP